jgi:hypothetical protein
VTLDKLAVPHYLIFRHGHDSYVLNGDRVLLRREASRQLCAFAKAHAKPMSIDSMLWDDFSLEQGFSAIERERPCSYALVGGLETEHQLRLLIGL